MIFLAKKHGVPSIAQNTEFMYSDWKMLATALMLEFSPAPPATRGTS